MELAKIIQKHVDCEIIEGKGSDLIKEMLLILIELIR